jgi:programmed cell death protein 5
MRENVLRVALTSEARQRLANIRIVKPEIAKAIEEYVIQVASSGKLRKPIDDDQLKEILGSLQGKKRDIRIRWI